MQPRISVRKGDVSNDTKEHIGKACDKFDQYFDRIVDCEVVVGQNKQGHEVEFVVKVPHQTLTASSTDDNLYKAVDEVQGKIATQLKKYHDKLVAHR
jgi:putative sigma-54 modulation protein